MKKRCKGERRPVEDLAFERVEKKEPGGSLGGDHSRRNGKLFPGAKTLKKGRFYVRL